MFVFIVKLLGYFFVFACFVYIWFAYRCSYWKRRNVYSPPWTFPTGNLGGTLRDMSLGFKYMEIYKQHKDKPFIGTYLWFARALVVNDLELLKGVMLKDAHHFQGHGFYSNKEVDPMGQHLFNLEGAEWRRMRTKLTPTFTSTKMKFMFNTLKDCTVEMVKYINSMIKYDNDIEIREVIARLGTDVISSCAFGIETNSFKNPNAEFRTMGRAIFHKPPLNALIDVIALFSPETMDLFKIRRINKKLTDFFYNAVRDTIDYREKDNVQRNDFLQLLINMRKSEEKSGSQLTVMEVAAQVFIFFAAGFETSSTAATFALFELAKNTDIREKLVKLIDEELEKSNGDITYELIHDFQFLTDVVNETLRMYPPLPLLTRRCTLDYKIPGTSVTIEKGTVIIIPIMGIQRDPDIYPDPTKFDPSRFSGENAQNINPFSHMPFGEGPRICIGNRFGMMQVKLALLMILKEFNVELSSKTELPLKINPKTFIIEALDGVYLKLTSRQDNHKLL